MIMSLPEFEDFLSDKLSIEIHRSSSVALAGKLAYLDYLLHTTHHASYIEIDDLH